MIVPTLLILYPLNLSNPTFLALVFKILAQQDEIARLKKQEESQTQAELKRIKGEKQLLKFILNTFSYILRKLKIYSVSLEDLEKELEDVRNQIREKTLMLDSSDTRISNLCKCSARLWSEKSKYQMASEYEKQLCLFLAAQIMKLHKKIKPLEAEISDLKEANTENLEGKEQTVTVTL